jgi:hypothetical protein
LRRRRRELGLQCSVDSRVCVGLRGRRRAARQAHCNPLKIKPTRRARRAALTDSKKKNNHETTNADAARNGARRGK